MRMFGVVVVVGRGWILVIGVCGCKAKVLGNNDKLWEGETSVPVDRPALRPPSPLALSALTSLFERTELDPSRGTVQSPLVIRPARAEDAPHPCQLPHFTLSILITRSLYQITGLESRNERDF
jgi:hypothetical protein